MNYDLKLVAYEPFGERIGPLPQPLHIEAANPLSDVSSMRIKYSRESVGAEHLNRPIEVAMEVLNPETGLWFEPSNSRFLSIRTEGDRLDANGMVDYVLPGYGWLLSKVAVYPLSKEFINGQVQDAELTEKNKRDILNKAEDAVTKAVGMKDSERVVFSENSPQGTNGVWVDTTNKTTPVVKTYVNNAWASNNKAGVQAAGKTAHTAWVAHQESQGQLSDTQARSKLTKRTFTGRHPGSVLAELISEARERGNRLAGLSTSFSTVRDSAGNPWPSFTGNVEVNVGSSLAKVLEAFVEAGQLDFRTLKRELQVYPQHTAMERKRDASHTLRYGVHIDEAPDRSTFESVAGEVLFMGDEGLSFTRSNPEAPQPWGVWETSVSQSGVKSEGVGDRLARNMLEQSSRQRVERVRALLFREGVNKPLPYMHYVPGDHIHAPSSDGSIESQRVQQVTLTRDGKTGLVAGNVVLNDRLIEREIRNARTTDALMGGAGSLGGNGGPRDKETYVDYRTPQPPQYLSLTSEANYVRDIGYQAYMGVEWYWGGKATNGTAMPDGVAHFQIQYRMFQEGTGGNDSASFSWVTAPNADGGSRDTIFGPVDAVNHRINQPAIYQVRARAYGVNGRVSDWSKVASVQVSLDTEPPEAPSRPVARAEGAVIYVSWDGKNHLGGKPPVDLYYVRVEEATVPEDILPDAEGNYSDSVLSSLTYAEATPFHLTAAGEALVMEREYEKPFVYRLIAVDLFGNESEPSLSSGAVATSPLVDDTLINERLEQAREELIKDQAELAGKIAVHDKAIADAKTELGNLDTFVDAELGKVTEKFTGIDSALSKATSDAASAQQVANAASQAAGDAASKFSDLDAKLEAALAAKPGLITDSSFELDDQWLTGGLVSIISSPVARSGSKVLAFEGSPTPTSTSLYGVQEISVVKDHEYRMTTHVRSTGTVASDQSVVMLVRRYSAGAWSLWDYSPITPATSLGVNANGWRVFQWTWTAPENATVGFGVQSRNQSSAVYFDDLQVVDATAEASLKLQVEVALKDAQAAAEAAQAAATAANTAQKSADGKSTVRYETTDPIGVGVAHNDTWYKTHPTTGVIVGHWRWSDTNKAWLPQTVDGSQVANFDAGYITSGYLDVANRIKAGSIYTDKMLIGVGDNMIPWTSVLNYTGVEPHEPHPSTSTLRLAQSSGVNNHIFAENKDPGTSRYLMRLTSAGQSGEGYGKDFPVSGGKSYRFESTVRAGGTYPEGMAQVRINIAWRTQGTGNWSEYSMSDWLPLSGSSQSIAVSAQAPADASAVSLFVLLDRPGGVRVIDPSFREMTDGNLIVNGSITANNVDADSITAMTVESMTAQHKNLIVSGDARISGKAYIEKLAAQEITSAKITVDQLTSLNSNFDEAVVNKLWAQKIAASKVSASEVVIGTGANLIVNGFGELGDSTNFSNFSRSDSPTLNSPIGAQSSFWTTSRAGRSLDNNWQVSPGQTYFWRIYSIAQNAGQRCYVQFRWFDASGSSLSSPYVVANEDPGTGSWKEWSGQITAPADAVTANVTLYANHSNGSWVDGQWQRWGGLVFQPASDGKLIVDGSITTKHLDARTIDITDVLRANSIKADKIDVASLTSKMITATVFQGKTFRGGTFQGSEFRTHSTRDKGIALFDSGMRVTDPRSGVRTFDINSGTGEVEITGRFSTGLPGKPSIIMSSANNSWNNVDQGVWFTSDGNAYGWGNSTKIPAAGVFTTSDPSRWGANVPLQLRGHGMGGVAIYDALILDSVYGNGGMIHVPSGGMSTGVQGGYVVNSTGGQVFSGKGHTRMNVGKTAGFYLGSDTYVRYNKNSSTGGTVRMADDGCIVVAFSTRKMKDDIQDAELDERILDVQPRTFLSKPAWEEYRALDKGPRPMEETESRRLDALTDDLRRQYGVIAEEVEDLGLTELVYHDSDGDPSSVNYELIGLKLLPLVKTLWEDYKSRQSA